MDPPLPSFELLQNLAFHVFLPPDHVLPHSELEADADWQVNLQIARSVATAVNEYKENDPDNVAQWDRIASVIDRVLHYIEVPPQKDRLVQDMTDLKIGDTLPLHIRAQNTAVLIRKKPSTTVFEVFEVQPSNATIMSTPGKIVRNYPGPAVEVPNSVAEDADFIEEIANILTQMDTELLEQAVAITHKADSVVHEIRDSTNPNYFIQLFLGILRGMGEAINPPRVVKRIADQVLWRDALKPWRRSPIWLIIRLAIQTSLDSKLLYKHFMAFYHADILSQCRNHDRFSSDLLYIMRVKMAGRLYKVKESVPDFVVEKARVAADDIQGVLQERWSNVQAEQAESPAWNPASLDLHAAKNQTLPNSRAYLNQVFQGRSGQKSASSFTPQHKLRLENIQDFYLYARGELSRAFLEDRHIALFDFEASVFEHLSTWTSQNLSNALEACVAVSACFHQYLTCAQSHYTVDVADQSIMILTLMKLWIAIDEFATHQIPLLHKFSPELPEDMLDPLLLRTSQHIEQARIIQLYLRARHARALSTNSSIFSDGATYQSVAVQYFRQSPTLQWVKSAIEQDAQVKRDAKLRELQEMNAEHARLGLHAASLSHEMVNHQSGGRWRSDHIPRSCRRCMIERKRDSMKITIHEWPLPSGDLEAQLAVFELQRPPVFTIWRDTTYLILRDLGAMTPPGSVNPRATLEVYSDLRPWLAVPNGIFPRVIVASPTKSFIQTHYSGKSIPAEGTSVCKNHGLQYKLFDLAKHCWAAGSYGRVKFTRYGTLSLPQNSSYTHLRYALEGTAHTSNRVLADQYNCPEDLSLHEHVAFGTLRSGPRLQWMNIARGIEENILTFSRQEVNILHTQAAWQIGPMIDYGAREWHEELRRTEYGQQLVSQLKLLLDRVRSNWLEATSVSTAVLVTTRLLVSSSDPVVTEEAYRFLRDARSVTLGWLLELQTKLKEAKDESTVIEYQNRVCEMAAICRSTFDVDPHHIPRLLSIRTPKDLAALVKCSVALYDNRPPDYNNASERLRILLRRDRRLSHKILPYILQQLHLNKSILYESMLNIWPDYNAHPSGWTELQPPNTGWVSSKTARVPGKAPQIIHLNLLEGCLLIDGEPLGRLPRDYVQHPTYVRVFGQHILDVVPASVPGMRFTTRDRVQGHQVSFMLDEVTNDLVIQARKHGQTFELIPFQRLADDFPHFLATDYHHWANLKSRTIEFRPVTHPWSLSDCRWLLRFAFNGVTTMESTVNGSFLADIHSPLFRSLSLQFDPLESSCYLHVTIPRLPESRVQIELPRLKLSFFINAEMQIESNNFRGNIIDKNQSTGAMFGLKNQLVLEAKDPVARSLPRSRSVLIPHGHAQLTRQGHHISITIHLGSNRHAPFHRYLVDTDLGYLTSDEGLTSRLYKIYLHALTSHCLPDILTGYTGTEEALRELSESSTFSFEQIDEAQGQLLNLIGSLTPDRKYYPAHLKCMQTTERSNLLPLSRHFAFSVLTSMILQRADTLQMFHPLDFNIWALVVPQEPTLLHRGARRSGVYYSSGTPSSLAEIFSDSNLDNVTQFGRDAIDFGWTEEGQIASWAAQLAYCNWGQAIYQPLNLVSLAESWNLLQGSYEDLFLTYSSRWLDLNLPATWITLYNLCRQAFNKSNKFRLSSCIASAAFSRSLPMDLVPAVIAFATNQEFATLSPPVHSYFLLADGYEPTRDRIQQAISSSIRLPGGSEPPRESGEDVGDEQNSSHESQIVEHLISQWPSSQLQPFPGIYPAGFAMNDCMAHVHSYFSRCRWNTQLHDYLHAVERILASRPPSQGIDFIPVNTLAAKAPVTDLTPHDHWSSICLGNLMRERPCPSSDTISSIPKISIAMKAGAPPQTSRLSALFSEFTQSSQPLNRRYGKELNDSRDDLANRPAVIVPEQLPQPQMLDENRRNCHAMLTSIFHRLRNSLAPLTSVEHIVFTSGVWPRITPRTLLQQLALQPRLAARSSAEWRKELVSYAQSFVDYQRSQRQVALAAANSAEEFWKELELEDTSCDIEEHNPDWLLVQIDGNFSARSVQRQVAKEMMSPSSGSSTVLQLNMGEGKSSIIIPLIAASLADSKQLVRIVVLKPLWRQMFHLLVNRLSGLANRRVYYLPFGRHIRVNAKRSQQLQELYTECMREGGVLLAQPEHILSFKLMGIDQLISAKSQELQAAQRLRSMQDWLTNNVRDILDESDEILYVRYQLVYSVGAQQPLENHPDRWTTTQQVLRLLAHHIARLEHNRTESFHYEAQSQGQFPTIRILSHCRREVEEELVHTIANDVLHGHIQNLNCTHLPLAIRKGVFRLLSTKEISYAEYDSLKNVCDPAMWQALLLVRGLLASGILVFALKERHYRVDYGLDLGRSLLAVPFRAKDIPSLRAEFGHPDVSVTLTCLSYYYKGLTDDQLDHCFELLHKLDNPSLEYEQWVQRNDDTPTDLRQLSGVNIKDRKQFLQRIIPVFSRNAAVIDFFLSSVVFPIAAKEFSHKLSTSGWDLAERKVHVTTGFSGTNDNRYLLPTSITQADPVKQLSTNALVLTYLLQPENNYYICMRGQNGRTISNRDFLKLLGQQDPEIRVLLDVGAQMLELQNEELVQCWLELAPSSKIEAAVYFNDEDELMVLPRSGTPSSFYSSPFAEQLDKCIVYLDDGHTRGTDLKLPRDARALVTLGPKVTKDRLLQGCMRMRQLGHGQSVMFAAPPEIDHQIRETSPNRLSPNDKVDALDVLRWTMLETCKDLQHHISHWANQGVEYFRRSGAQQEYTENQNPSILQQSWMIPEARKLEEMYGVFSPTSLPDQRDFTQRVYGITSLRERLDLLGVERLEDPSMGEEQEREVSHEVEREQQVQRPPKKQPLTPTIHQDVEHFVHTGRIPAQSSVFTSLFQPFASYGSDVVEAWSTKLFASVDFSRVIAGAETDSLSQYMRPVNWIVQGADGVLVVLSPHEVNGLLPAIRRSTGVSLHVYAPRVSQFIRAFSNLDFYSIPSQLQPSLLSVPLIIRLQLGLFAGQLYLSNYDEYTLLVAFLGLHILPPGGQSAAYHS